MQISIVGEAGPTPEIAALAQEVGAELGRRRITLVCGGGRGVMAAACRGAKSEGGTTVGILPSSDPDVGNRLGRHPHSHRSRTGSQRDRRSKRQGGNRHRRTLRHTHGNCSRPQGRYPGYRSPYVDVVQGQCRRSLDHCRRRRERCRREGRCGSRATSQDGYNERLNGGE